DNNMEGVENEWRDVHQLEDLQPRDRIKIAEIGVQVGDDLSFLISSITETEKKLKSATGLHSVQLLDSLTKCADEIAPDNPCKKLHLTTKNRIIRPCSAAFGGRASDKVITKHTGIYDMCDPGDGIMVDKGYHIEEECENNMLVLIRPPFLRTNKKFSRAEAVQCAKIARARVHVERVIQRVRCFNILKNRIPWNLVPFIDDLVIIVSALVNLGNPIMARDKY
ncbi:GTP cyclohydrolase 1, partial [Frankliniella fusca]